jgi:hypothetical protein
VYLSQLINGGGHQLVFLGMNHVVTPKSWKEELDSVGRTAIVTLEMLPDDPTPWII